MSIELIYLGRDTATLVPALSNDWLICGPIRACIFLSNAWHLMEPESLTKEKDPEGKNALHHILNGHNVFGPNNLGHPWSQWTVESEANYNWLYFYALDMVEEYPKRFPHLKGHGIARMLSALENMPKGLSDDLDWSEPSFAANVGYST